MKSTRKFCILTKKRIVEFYKSGLKNEKQIRQEYGLTPTLLEKLVGWYNKHFINPHKSYYKTQKIKTMKRSKRTAKKATTSKEKSLEQQLKKLQKEKKELEQALEWAQLKSHVYETMVDVAEKELNLPIRKKFGTKQSEK